LLLGRLGISIGTAITTFQELGPKIFGHKWNWIPVMLGMKQRFDHRPLETVLKKLCDERLLNDGSLLVAEDGITHVMVFFQFVDAGQALADPDTCLCGTL
jgi:hypothetical protein